MLHLVYLRAICRVAKGAAGISGKSDHHYRLGHVPNVDTKRRQLNQELVLNYENLDMADRPNRPLPITSWATSYLVSHEHSGKPDID